MVAVIAILCMLTTPAIAASVQATVSATVVEPASISQSSDGTITLSGEKPLYCESTPQETMCYY